MSMDWWREPSFDKITHKSSTQTVTKAFLRLIKKMYRFFFLRTAFLKKPADGKDYTDDPPVNSKALLTH